MNEKLDLIVIDCENAGWQSAVWNLFHFPHILYMLRYGSLQRVTEHNALNL